MTRGLGSVQIGVQMIGNDSMNAPPGHAIASRGIIDNVRGYMVYGSFGSANPSAAMIDAVRHRQIDVERMGGHFRDILQILPKCRGGSKQ